MKKQARCPDVVKIGAQEYQIVQLGIKDDPILTEGNHGYTQDARNIIVLDKEIHESKKKVTVFHELMHACRFVFEVEEYRPKADYDEVEHHFIGLWENSLLMVLRDNRELREWLIGE
jgi:Zn-dependent peptidase ImmA (M78 family)